MLPNHSRDQANQGGAQSLTLRLAAIPYTGAISDILDEMGLREQVLPHDIHCMRPGQTVAGPGLVAPQSPRAPKVRP